MLKLSIYFDNFILFYFRNIIYNTKRNQDHEEGCKPGRRRKTEGMASNATSSSQSRR